MNCELNECRLCNPRALTPFEPRLQRRDARLQRPHLLRHPCSVAETVRRLRRRRRSAGPGRRTRSADRGPPIAGVEAESAEAAHGSRQAATRGGGGGGSEDEPRREGAVPDAHPAAGLRRRNRRIRRIRRKRRRRGSQSAAEPGPAAANACPSSGKRKRRNAIGDSPRPGAARRRRRGGGARRVAAGRRWAAGRAPPRPGRELGRGGYARSVRVPRREWRGPESHAGNGREGTEGGGGGAESRAANGDRTWARPSAIPPRAPPTSGTCVRESRARMEAAAAGSVPRREWDGGVKARGSQSARRPSGPAKGRDGRGRGMSPAREWRGRAEGRRSPAPRMEGAARLT